MQSGRPFLTAAWRYLAMLNFRVDRAALDPIVPAGTELDLWQGDAIVSVVGFRFQDTRVHGWHVPCHADFDEINLRFYVRRVEGREVRRGVTFIREIVPRRAIAIVARAAYNEPYVACPMRHRAPDAAGVASPGTIEYAWRHRGAWRGLHLRATGRASDLAAGSEAEFITEHHWGYTRQRDGATVEYRVEHPRWRVWAAEDAGFDGDVAGFYGGRFADALGAAPCSAFLADGSAVVVGRPRRLGGAS